MSLEPRTEERVERLYLKLKKEAEAGGYHLNGDEAFAKDLIRGLLANEERYGYPSCPCRLASGTSSEDRDIICPCDYRDPDLTDYGACYCALYVSRAVLEGRLDLESIPERRPAPEARHQGETEADPKNLTKESLSYPVWRCRVCGYLCARDNPPETCPICKAGKDRFERFM